MKTPKELYLTHMEYINGYNKGNTWTVITTKPDSKEIEENRWREQVKQEIITNDPKEYFIDDIAYGKPMSRIILKDINDQEHETRLSPIIELVKKYGVEVGGKLGVKLVWKTDGHMFLDEV